MVDANTYSSGDLFTAGLVDNGIGPVICVGQATGAGGANVWELGRCTRSPQGGESPLAAAARPASVSRVAMRRAVRSGEAEGSLIEDAGVPASRTR